MDVNTLMTEMIWMLGAMRPGLPLYNRYVHSLVTRPRPYNLDETRTLQNLATGRYENSPWTWLKIVQNPNTMWNQAILNGWWGCNLPWRPLVPGLNGVTPFPGTAAPAYPQGLPLETWVA